MKVKKIVLIAVLCILLLPACEKTTLNNSKQNNAEVSLESIPYGERLYL